MNFLDNTTVSRKLWMSTLLIIMALVAVAAASQRLSAVAMQDAMEDLQAHDELIREATNWKGMTATNFERVLITTLSNEPAVTDAFSGKLKQGIADISVLQKHIVEQASTEADKAALATIAERRARVLDLTKKSQEVKAQGDAAATRAFVEKDLSPAVETYLDGLGDFVKLQESHRDAVKKEAFAARMRSAAMGLAAMAVVVVLALLSVRFIVRSIANPLDRAVAASEAIAGGDLTVSLKTRRRDELGRLLRAMDEMAARLRSVVSQVRSGVESVGTASEQIATGNEDLSHRTEEQASNLQQTASSMEQIASTVNQNADNARAAAQLASGASDVAARGGAVVGRVVEAMADITESSRKIADIISVIDGIAFQTNILALNAAVEAARAGEQGRGFAVVASEVRSLAQRSASAAREIKSLIEKSVEKVGAGSELVGTAGRTMEEVVSQVKRVNDLVSEITSASVEQASGIGQVGEAVSQLDQVTQQNAALVEEAAAAAESMKSQARRLAEVVAVFNVGSVSPAA
ncbi:MAG: HAMP domain-containing protein [Rhizobacter sp.]|nr:HAMP domain-containing protein [Rhizobacter sp.]